MNSSNVRITVLKNTLFLYVRFFITILVSLYTSRIVLQALGVDDFGIYVIVNSIIGIFYFFQASFDQTAKRFLSFEIGKNDSYRLKETFGSLLSIYGLLCLLLIICYNTFGLFFLNNYLNIDSNKIFSANIVFQVSILTSIILLIKSPYLSAIIANEKMSIYAYISIIEVSFKLLLIYLLLNANTDKLILYSLLLAFTEISIFFLIYFVCIKRFHETRFRFRWNKNIIKKILRFSVWTFYGKFVLIFIHNILNIILNLFYGTAVNGSLGMSRKLGNLISQFVSNFQIALNPAITKSFAQKKLSQLNNLLFDGSKYGFYLMIIIGFPVIYEMDAILSFWLEDVPKYCSEFATLIIINKILDTLTSSIELSAEATENIKKYKLVVYTFILFSLPLSFLILYLDYPPFYVFYISILFTVLSIFLRLVMLSKILKFSINDYFKSVIIPVSSIFISNILILFIYSKFLEPSNFRFLSNSLFVVFSTSLCIYFIGFNKKERNFIVGRLRNHLKFFK